MIGVAFWFTSVNGTYKTFVYVSEDGKMAG